MVSTVGPVSKVKPSRWSTPAQPRHLFSFDHGDVVPAAREITRRRQTGQTRPDYDNGVHIRAPIAIMMLTGQLAQLGGPH